MNNRQTENKITALYERLSHDDGLVNSDSNSIVNQKQQLEDYAASKGFTNCVHYTDAADIIGLNQNPFTEGNDLVLFFLFLQGNEVKF